MEKESITATQLYINKINGVFHHKRSAEHKFSHSKNRYSDAFLFVIKGKCKYDFDDGQTFTVNPSDAFFLSKNSSYQMETEGEYRVLYCDFCFDCEKVLKPDVYQFKNPQKTEALFRKLYNIYSNPQKTSFHQLMTTLYEIYADLTLSKNRDYVGATSRIKIEEAKNYIDIHFADADLSISHIADKFDISEAYLRKIFKSLYNTSPSQYIIDMRIQKAKELMKSDILSMEECAVMSGFCTLQYFARVFKERTGMTPGKYRKHL